MIVIANAVTPYLGSASKPGSPIQMEARAPTINHMAHAGWISAVGAEQHFATHI
jgi:hypothetical protein